MKTALQLELDAIENELERTMPKGISWVLLVVRGDGSGSACSSLDLDEAACVDLMRAMADVIEEDRPGNLAREIRSSKGGSS